MSKGIYKLRIFNKNGVEIPHFRNEEEDIFEGDLYMNKVSTGLVETETLVILYEDEEGNLHPFWEQKYKNFTLNDSSLNSPTDLLGYISNSSVSALRNFILNESKLNSTTDVIGPLEKPVKLLLFIDTEEQENLQFFTVSKESDEIKWGNKLLVGFDEIHNSGIHLGFIGDKEGVYETDLYVCEVATNETNPDDIKEEDIINYCGKFTVHSEAIGEDERYRHMFTNFGIPDPISYLDIFKDKNIFINSEESEQEREEYYRNNPLYHKYDDLIDYRFLNEKSKELYLSYSDIFPYVGTYKALVNAVDYLGFDDIYFKEWFKELSNDPEIPSKNVTYEVAYRSGGKSLLTKLPLEKRLSLKKLNWLSMVYKISEFAKDENGEIMYEELPDNVRVPLIQYNYADYNSDEILVKLIALKDWLERYIIGLNCRIIEINGEGIVVERYKNRIYGKTIQTSVYETEMTVTPFIENTNSELELSNSMCKLRFGLKEQNEMDVSTFLDKYKKVTFKAYLSTNNSAFSHREIDGKIYGFTDVPIIVENGEIFFDSKNSFRNYGDESIGNNGGSESVFIKYPTILLENAKLRNPNIAWSKSVKYSIDDKGNGGLSYRFIRMPKSLDDKDTILYSNDYISLRPYYEDGRTPMLKYSTDNELGVPMFMFSNFADTDIMSEEEIIEFVGDADNPNVYVLEILDGKFIFNEDDIYVPENDDYSDHVTKTTYLNFNFDTDSNEQNIEVNYVYSKIADLQEWASEGRTYLDTLTVNNTGDYTILAFATDEYNNIYCNQLPQTVTVYMRDPSIYIYTNNSYSNNSEDFYNKNEYGELVDYFETELTEINIPENKEDDSTIGKNTMSELFLDNDRCKMKESFLSKDVSILEYTNGEKVIKYATYPTISYSIDTPKKGDTAHFLDICDEFKCIKYLNNKDKGDDWIDADSNNSNLIVFDDYLMLFLKRNETFKGNTLNTNLMLDASDCINLMDVNIVIYDKIHNDVVYQDIVKLNYDPEKDYNYLYISNSIVMDYFVYYKDDAELKHVLYDSEDTESYVMNNNEFDYEVSNVSDFLSKNRVYTIFVQPFYSIPVEYIVHYSKVGEKRYTTFVIPNDWTPDNENIFKSGDKINIKYSKSLDSRNIIESQATYTITDSNKSFISVEGYYSFGRFEEGTDYYTTTIDENGKLIPTENISEDEIRTITNGIEKHTKFAHDIVMGLEKMDESVLSSGLKKITLSHANLAYVDYEIPVERSVEDEFGKVELYVKDDGFLYYVDNTYSVITKPFSTRNAVNSWMGSEMVEIDEKEVPVGNISKSNIYKYGIPVTLNYNDANITITPSTTYEGFQTFSRDLNERHSYWKIYKYDKYSDRNVLQFESWNDALFLNITEEGIYTVEVSLYDNYGNVIMKKVEGLFKITEN